jgi:hypothetical protein
MPTHDAMYTAHVADQLRTAARKAGDKALARRLTGIENRAVEASSAGARVAVDMFTALDIALKSDNPEVVKAAERIYASSFNQIVA